MIELELVSCAFGGDAVGRHQGQVVFVPYGVPGDRAMVRLTKRHASYCRGELVELIVPSPARRDPPCPLFGTCGGCHWQQMHYQRQVSCKQEIFAQTMRTVGVEKILPLQAAPTEFAYRRRTRLHWTVNRGEVVLGYFQRNSKRLINVTHCPLLTEPLLEALAVCRQALRLLASGRGSLVAIATASHQVHLSLRLEHGQLNRVPEIISALSHDPIIGGELQGPHEHACFGQPAVDLSPGRPPALWAAATAFLQANAPQEQQMRDWVGQWVEEKPGRLLELFSGIGNLTQRLMVATADIVTVESSPASIPLLQRNLSSKPQGVTILAQDAERALIQLINRKQHFDLALLNPPREGCAAVAGLLGESGVGRVAYISCDPMTLKRDLKIMSQHGLHAVQARALDMMPQTFHLEGVVFLER